MSKQLACIVILFVAAGFTFCAPVAAETYKIGVILSHESPGLRSDQRGFEKALAEAGIQAEINTENAEKDSSNAESIAKKFVDDKVDLVHAVGLEAAQAAAKAISQIPVVYSAVRDPVGAGGVSTLPKGDGNVTGVSNAWPIDQQVDLFHRILPAAKKWGTIYNGDDPITKKAIEEARAAMQQRGLELIEAPVSNFDEISPAAKSLIDRADAFFITADPMVAKNFGPISRVCKKNKIPLFSGNPNHIGLGAVATLGADFFQVGYSAGHKAVQILKEGKTPGEIPSGISEHLIFYINLKNAKNQGVQVAEEFIKQADRVFK